MAVIGNAPALGIITGDNILDGSIQAADLAPGAAVPSQTGNAGKYLTTDGTDSSWATVDLARTLTILTHSGATTELPITVGSIAVTTHSGSTVNVSLI